ncbi:hypothetical protein BJ878DRAFT_216717 [Calycina marina]|uniref:Uncharacterized protein n=1 Tax=Calycina marina TaxID=1763456 RepID=A0A9P7YX61_9HELO|nr:hypothetical protein BJ878DRAFT_216717 [Calycina marina]
MSFAQEINLSQSLDPQKEDQMFTPPKTPPEDNEVKVKIVHPWPEPETEAEEGSSSKRRKIGPILDAISADVKEFKVSHQEVLWLHAPKERYKHSKEQAIHTLNNDREMLVAVKAIGLNPIDWKAPDFGWGLPVLPAIAGRDLAGKVAIPPNTTSRFKQGDNVLAISTDYRDNRKAAFQQYTVVSDFNACKLPSHVTASQAAPIGVAFVAAALALGICAGLDFLGTDDRARGPDLLRAVRALPRDAIAKDIQEECFEGVKEDERAKAGDWIVIWGGSSASACCAIQLAKLGGMKVIAVVDIARSGDRMLKYGADLLVDRMDPARAIAIIKGVTNGKLRFALDAVGRPTASILAQTMCAELDSKSRAHLVGLVAVPKPAVDGVVSHSVPIKAFHEAPAVGEGLCIWLENLIAHDMIILPDIEIAEGGLGGINTALDRLRDGSVNGPRIVVPL